MAHLQNQFGLLPPDIATILPWSESLDTPVALSTIQREKLKISETKQRKLTYVVQCCYYVSK